MTTEVGEQLYDPSYGGEPERMFVFHVDAWDVNCPQHITPRFTEKEIGDSVVALRARIKGLEAKVRNCCPEDVGAAGATDPH